MVINLPGFTYSVNLTKQNIVQFIFAGLVFLLLAWSYVVYKNGDINISFRKILIYTLNYILLILETTLGVFISASLFVFDYINYYPFVVLLLYGLSGFVIMEIIKERIKNYIKNGSY